MINSLAHEGLERYFKVCLVIDGWGIRDTLSLAFTDDKSRLVRVNILMK